MALKGLQNACCVGIVCCGDGVGGGCRGQRSVALPPGRGAWDLARRVFTRPEPTAATIHPYENEPHALDGVANQWGQRVTSMVPLDDFLFISTSANWPCPWDPKFDFVGEEAGKEQRTVTRVHVPGHLSAAVTWIDGPTELRFAISDLGEVRQVAYGVLKGARLEGELRDGGG